LLNSGFQFFTLQMLQVMQMRRQHVHGLYLFAMIDCVIVVHAFVSLFLNCFCT
jgi:hypothetical protein